MESMESKFKFADSVFHRIVQIVQEAMLTGVDCTDLLRQLSVVPDESDPHVLVLSQEYQEQVRAMHQKLLDQANQLRASRGDPNFVITTPPRGLSS